MSLGLYIVNNLTSLLPPTRLYLLKAKLYKLAGVTIDPTVMLVSSVRIWGEGSVSIGQKTFIGHDTLIVGGESSINIGKEVDIAPRVIIISGSHKIDSVNLRTAGKGISRPINIEDGVWIGASTTILGGVRIGKKSIIAAGSVVINDIPSEVVAAGVPCKVVRNLRDTQ